MAIVQISRIQHRRGIKTLLPQLAAGELGWAVDTQELYIGNGTVEEGAPEVGNTKILTEDDDILALASSYTFKGNTTSTVTTGVDANSPVVRTIQSKLDDYVSVKDFGAQGDGVTDDTAAINRAIQNLLTVEETGKERRQLHFPGGTYLVSDVIKLYPYTQLIGEGMESTFIKQTSDSATCLLRTADQNGNISSGIGDDGAVKPQGIECSGIHFITERDRNLIILDQCEDVHFRTCHFTGVYQGQDGDSSTPAKPSLITVNTATALPTKRIFFSDCTFEKSYYAVQSDDDIQDVFFISSEFDTCYRAFNLAENSDGSTTNKTVGPTGVIISSCRFDRIDAEAVYIHSNGGNPRGNIVANCSFRDVGQNGDDSSDLPALSFQNGGNFAHHNYFYRTDAISNFAGTVYHEGPVESAVSLTNNVSSQDTGITIDLQSQNHIKIEYVLSRDTARQSGTLFVNGTTGSAQLDDQSFQNASTGVTFSIDSATGKVQYTTTNTGFTATFKYRIINFL